MKVRPSVQRAQALHIGQLVSWLASGHTSHGIHTVAHLSLCGGLRLLFELFAKRLVVEEGPRVVELVIPRPFQVVHALQHSLELLVAHQRQDGSIDARTVCLASRCIIVALDSAQRATGLARCCNISSAARLDTFQPTPDGKLTVQLRVAVRLTMFEQ
jgi:hypothetical protein